MICPQRAGSKHLPPGGCLQQVNLSHSVGVTSQQLFLPHQPSATVEHIQETSPRRQCPVSGECLCMFLPGLPRVCLQLSGDIQEACRCPVDFPLVGRQGRGKHQAFRSLQAGPKSGTAHSWLGDLAKLLRLLEYISPH